MNPTVRKAIYLLCMLLALVALAVPLFQSLAVPPPEAFQSIHAAQELPPLIGLSADSFLNTADAAELDALPGIGAVISQRMVDVRENIGGFRLAEDLLLVQGIGEKVMEKILNALDESLVELESFQDTTRILIN